MPVVSNECFYTGLSIPYMENYRESFSLQNADVLMLFIHCRL